MKILIDIGHPAHVHYFRNFIKIMEAKGHSFFCIARDRDCIKDLLEFYKIKSVYRGKGSKKFLGKLLYAIKAYSLILRFSIRFKPDLLISHGGIYTAPIAFLMRKVSIVTEDTEHAKWSHRVSKLFNSVFLSPTSFYNNLSDRQIFFNGNMELAYLHKKRFKANSKIDSLLKINKQKKYVVLRFVSWDAHHDVGYTGFKLEEKIRLVNELSQSAQVLISSESELPEELLRYKVDILPENMHHLLENAELFVSESGTMASESAVLGTPVIYTNSLPLMGYLKEEQEAGLLYHLLDFGDIIDKANEIIKHGKNTFSRNHKNFINNKIDVTAFIVWFVENFPNSYDTMKENPAYQNVFRY